MKKSNKILNLTRKNISKVIVFILYKFIELLDFIEKVFEIEKDDINYKKTDNDYRNSYFNIS